jgi:hypothetical protein
MNHAIPLRLIVAVVGALALTVLLVTPASAATTHKLLGQVTLASGTNPQPSGVDPEGNIIVFLDDQEVIAKYDPSGNPVNFSALGTNVIDGEGGLECPVVPTDCDRVPAGKLGPFVKDNNIVVVDSSGGPANGYIYVRNHDKGKQSGELAVFASSGEYLGTVDEAQAQPWADPNVPAHFMSMAPNGTLYVARGRGTGLPAAGSAGITGGHVDQYAPTDGDPAHDVFVGQLRFAFQYPVDEVDFPIDNIIGLGDNGAFVLGGNKRPEDLGDWRYYSFAEFQKPASQRYSFAQDYLPFPSDNKAEYDDGAVNPETGNIHRFNPGAGMVIWDQSGRHKVGPTIATSTSEIASGARSIAFDNSGGPNQGRFYIKGGADKLSVFSAPVVIPDIEVGDPDEHHKAATLNLEVDPAGGPDVTACTIEYGLTSSYGTPLPCSPAPPYSGNTEVSVELPGIGSPDLFTETDYHYRVKAVNENGFNLTADQVVHTVAVLGLRTGEATGLTGTSATLNGSLDPDGMSTTYRFQYGISTNYDLETPEEDAGSGSGVVQIDPAEIEQLQPGRTYHYRLVAENELGTTFGEDRTFTVPAKPLISSLHPRNVAATSAELNARINNYDSDAEYHFEYGTTAAYGQITPAQQLAADPSPQPVSVQLGGLQPGVTYHFRLVATNEYGTSKSPNATFDFVPPNCPNAHVRQQTGSNYLPDCRAYELVSPPRAGSIQLFPGDLLERIEEDFELVNPRKRHLYQNGGYASSPPRFGFYGGLGGLHETNSPNLLFDHYVSTRTSTGWITRFIGSPGDQTGFSWRGQCSISFDRCIDYRAEETPDDSTARRPFPYAWDASGKFLGRWPTNLPVVPGADHLIGDERPSGDFRHFAFSSLDVAFVPGGLETAPGSVYDNSVDSGTISIVSKRASGDDIPQDGGDEKEHIRIPAVSLDGSHILMSTETSNGTVNLYMRVNNAVSFEVSGGVGVELIGMSSSGDTVAFTSVSVLTPEDEDSSRDIYLWEEETDSVRLISTGNGNGNSDSCNANWTQKCDVAPITPERPDIDDVMAAGGDIYFYSPEQLDAANPGILNQRNLYHLKDGEIQYVTTFDPGTQADRMQISADGEHAAFLTTSELTGYDSNYFDSFGVEKIARQMYVFDALSGEVQCASCNPSGEPPTVLRSDPPANETGATSADVMASKSGRFMSEDGRVAFATAEALVPRDTSGKIDVYEFVEGRPQLISSGTGERDILSKLGFFLLGHNTGLEAVSRDGIDIYFSTYDTLVPQDQNGPFIKFYVARTGGGFPVEGELLPCAAADECHGSTSVPAANPEVGTATPYSVTGNSPQVRARKKANRKQRLRKKQLRRQRRARRLAGGRNG